MDTVHHMVLRNACHKLCGSATSSSLTNLSHSGLGHALDTLFYGLQYRVIPVRTVTTYRVSISSPLPESIGDSVLTHAHSGQIQFSARTWCIHSYIPINRMWISSCIWSSWSQVLTARILRMISLIAIGCWREKCCCRYVRYQTSKRCCRAYWQRYLQWKIPLNCDSCASIMRVVWPSGTHPWRSLDISCIDAESG